MSVDRGFLGRLPPRDSDLASGAQGRNAADATSNIYRSMDDLAPSLKRPNTTGMELVQLLRVGGILHHVV